VLIGTLLLVLVVGGGIVGIWKYRAIALGHGGRERRPLSDEALVALARQHDAMLNSAGQDARDTP
jgi:hypothetical protein